MNNFRHTLVALLSVVIIGSLAVTQATDITAAKANKISEPDNKYLTVSETVNENATSVIDVSETNEESTHKNLELIDFRRVATVEYKNTTVERAKPFEPVSGYVITTTGGLNIRADKSLDSQILASITYGQEIDIIDEADDWYVIPYGEDGGVGYVLKEYVTTSYEEARKILLESVMFESGVVAVDDGALNVRSAPGTEGTLIIDQISSGDCIIVLDRIDDEWMKVYYGNNYEVGYIMSQYANIGGMTPRTEVEKKRVERINAISQDGIIITTGSYVNMRKMPSEEAAIVRTFKNKEDCLIVARGSEWTKVAYGPYRITGYVKSEFVKDKDAYLASIAPKNTTKKSTSTKTKTVSNANPASSSKGQAIVNEAAKYIGVKYVYGGTSPSGFDCSGLVQYVCKKVGISVNRTSRAQYSNGVAVSKSNLEPGDLVFFSKGSGISHVGIYAGGGQVIHAPSPGKKVCYIALSKICSYSTYVGARRVY